MTDTPPPDDEAAGSRPAHAGWVVDHIRTHGPLTVAAFMAKALTDRDHGYYRHRPAIGTEARGGDFTTAPEISQVFGELIGVWLALAWQQFGAPDRLRIVELGPGRGTLIRDARRAFRQVVRTLGEPVPTLDLVLVEINPTLREIQAATLGTGSQEAMAGHAPRWVADVRQVAGDPSHTGSVDRSGAWPCVLVANEFIDALPVSQLVRTERSPTGWAERTVALDGEERLCFDKGAPAANPVGGAQGGQGTPNATAAAAIGAIAESRAETLRALALATTIAGWAAQAPFAGLIIDYGYEGPAVGDTLQAVARHRSAHPLAAPGEHDLSAHVDFAELSDVLRNAGLAVAAAGTNEAAAMNSPARSLPQATFLEALGIGARTEALARDKDAATINALQSGAARLIASPGMGDRFRVLHTHSADILPVYPWGPAPR